MPKPTPSTRAQRALVTLRQRIISGDIDGGTRLFEVALAEELEISRTPIRAALSQLAEEGLLERAKGGGFVVRSFNLSDVVDTIEIRGVLEGTAARFAAERGATPEDLAAARHILGEIDQVLSNNNIVLEEYSRHNSAFHNLLVDMARSPMLEREIARVTALPFASPSAFLSDERQHEALRRSLTQAHEQHHAIVDAIANREGARAEALAREHARTARKNVEFLTAQETALREGVAPLALLNT